MSCSATLDMRSASLHFPGEMCWQGAASHPLDPQEEVGIIPDIVAKPRRRWGRPALRPGAPLDRSVTIQLGSDTRNAWRAAAKREGVSLSAWVRGRVGVEGHESNRNASPASPTRTARGRGAVDPELARQVAVLGNSANQ